MNHSRSGNDAIKRSGVSKTAVRDNWESSRGKYPVKSQSAKLRPACVYNTHHRGQGRQRQNGSGPTCNHKMSTGLPDAGNRRLFRSSMRKPFSRSHCPVPARDWALSFYIFSRHRQGSVCAARIIIHRSVIVLRALSRSLVARTQATYSGNRPELRASAY